MEQQQNNTSTKEPEQQQEQQITLKQKKVSKKFINKIPDEILNNKLLNNAIKMLPSHYNFEIQKTIWRIECYKEELQKENMTVCLQFPEGLMLFACLLADIISNFADVECVIMGDVTYGACCVDDLTPKTLQSDFVIHYGHSCLVPINETCTKTLYVFVEISIDMNHFKETVLLNFKDKQQFIYLMGTVQFNTVMFQAKLTLEEEGYQNVVIPQEKPRSQGEVLGCTSPSLEVKKDQENVMLFIADGRFHMESAMIANPDFTTYQYNPYSKELTIETYGLDLMKEIRSNEIKKAQKNIQRVCVLFGTLGRQGSSHILNRIEQVLIDSKVEYFVMLVSEINFDQLGLIAEEVDFFVQVSCPRLSIDWGSQFYKPLLSPYEFFVTMKQIEWRDKYPMDYYSNNGDIWTNYYHKKNDKPKKAKVRLQFEQK